MYQFTREQQVQSLRELRILLSFNKTQHVRDLKLINQQVDEINQEFVLSDIQVPQQLSIENQRDPRGVIVKYPVQLELSDLNNQTPLLDSRGHNWGDCEVIDTKLCLCRADVSK
jgi:hypothetical protein